jgi:hypothetical protein
MGWPNNFVQGVYNALGSLIGIEGGGVTYSLIQYPVQLLKSSGTAVSSTTTGADDVLASYVVPAGTMGVNSQLQIEPCWDHNSSANNKILKVIVGGVTVFTRTRTTSLRDCPLVILMNKNSLTSQIAPYDSQAAYGAIFANSSATYAIDFSTDVTVQITGQRANAGDTLALSYYRIMHIAGA